MVLIIFILFLEKKSFLYLMEDAGADRYMLKTAYLDMNLMDGVEADIC